MNVSLEERPFLQNPCGPADSEIAVLKMDFRFQPTGGRELDVSRQVHIYRHPKNAEKSRTHIEEGSWYEVGKNLGWSFKTILSSLPSSPEPFRDWEEEAVIRIRSGAPYEIGWSEAD